MLGGNDAKTQNWNETAFVIDYTDFYDELRDKLSDPWIHLMRPTPGYIDGAYEIQ